MPPHHVVITHIPVRELRSTNLLKYVSNDYTPSRLTFYRLLLTDERFVTLSTCCNNLSVVQCLLRCCTLRLHNAHKFVFSLTIMFNPFAADPANALHFAMLV